MAERRKLSDFAVGNAVIGGRSSVEGVKDEMARRFEAMAASMPLDVLARLQVISGYRDAARQAQVNPEVKNSRHMHGIALDLGDDPVVLDWIDKNGRPHGLGFPLKHMANEQNHLEMIDPDTGARADIGGQYAANPGAGFKTGLRHFGVAEANLPTAGGDLPQQADAGEADRKALLASLALQGAGSFNPGGILGSGSLSSALTQGLQPQSTQPQPLVPLQSALIGGPLPLARKLI